MEKVKEPEHKQPENKEEPEFQSKFKAWIRVVAFLVVTVFLPEQIAWAIDFNPSIIWRNLPALSAIQHPANQIPGPEVFNKAVAKSIYGYLKPLAKKEVNQVQLKAGINIDVENSALDLRQIKRIYNWLKDPKTETVPCSAYVLYNLLKSFNISIPVEQLSSLLILIDILNGNITAPLATDEHPERIYNSIYAIQKTAQYFGLNLSAVKLPTADSQLLTSDLAPFIAHLSSDKSAKGHFVLVTEIDEEKVHYFYDKGNTFLPKDKFLEEFTGFCLIDSQLKNSLPEFNSLQLNIEQTKGIQGARYVRKAKLDVGFWDAMLSLGLTIGFAAIGAIGADQGFSTAF